MNKKYFNKIVKAASKQLSAFVKPTYFDGIPLQGFRDIFESLGFTVHDLDGIYCGNGNTNVKMTIGEHAAYLTFSWYKMPSGKMEIVAYVS